MGSTMGKRATELGALQVKHLQHEGLHFVGGVAGLALQIIGGSKSWLLRVAVAGRRRDMGLGAYPEVGVADARRLAAAAREQIRQGIDPIAQRRAAQQALRTAAASHLTFDQAAARCIEAREAGWKNAKHGKQWSATLQTYAFPIIGKLHVADIALPHVLQVLEPVWRVKPETASRLRQRVETVLSWATTRGYRHGDNPARWRGHLDQVLPAPSSVQQVVHHAALPVDQVGAFMQRLQQADGIGALALRFAVLCASRSGEVRGATWSEVDMQRGVWVIPGSRMKAKREHRVPLSADALALLQALPRYAGTDLLFPSSKGTALSDATLLQVCRRMGIAGVPHGFRSTFRDWAAERTSHPSEVVEMALAHTVGDKVEAAYRRGDLFEKRRALMEDWARFCDPLPHVDVAGSHPTGAQTTPATAQGAL